MGVDFHSHKNTPVLSYSHDRIIIKQKFPSHSRRMTLCLFDYYIYIITHIYSIYISHSSHMINSDSLLAGILQESYDPQGSRKNVILSYVCVYSKPLYHEPEAYPGNNAHEVGETKLQNQSEPQADSKTTHRSLHRHYQNVRIEPGTLCYLLLHIDRICLLSIGHFHGLGCQLFCAA